MSNYTIERQLDLIIQLLTQLPHEIRKELERSKGFEVPKGKKASEK